MATLYKINEFSKKVKPKNRKFFTYKELQDFVKDGENKLIEIVPMPSGKSMVVNEEDKLINLPKNVLATQVWKKKYPISEYPHNNDELIVGNALVLEESELQQDE